MNCSICHTELEGPCGDQCEHKFHARCLLIAREMGATGCPCCPGNEVNTLLRGALCVRKVLGDTKVAMERMDIEFEIKGEFVKDSEYDKFMGENRYDVTRYNFMERVATECENDIMRYNTFIDKLISKFACSSERTECTECPICTRSTKDGMGVYKMLRCPHSFHTKCLLYQSQKCPCCVGLEIPREIGEFNKTMREKDVAQAEYYKVRFDLEYRVAERFEEIDDVRYTNNFMKNNWEQYEKMLVLRNTFEEISKGLGIYVQSKLEE